MNVRLPTACASCGRPTFFEAGTDRATAVCGACDRGEPAPMTNESEPATEVEAVSGTAMDMAAASGFGGAVDEDNADITNATAAPVARDFVRNRQSRSKARAKQLDEPGASTPVLDRPSQFDQKSGTPVLLKVTAIDPSPDNPRKTFGQQSLDELAATIRDRGILQPLLVRPYEAGLATDDPAHTRYRIVAGERRWRAAQLAGLSHVPVVVRQDLESDDAGALLLSILENLHREDLDPIEEARGFQALQKLGHSQRQIADLVKKSQPVVANAIRILRLPDDVLALVSSGALSVAHAIALVRFADFPEVVNFLAQSVVKNRTPSKDLERGIPFAWWLQDAGIGVSLRDATNPHAETCKACPFGAYQANEHRGEGMCFRPQHWQELETERRAHERDQRAQQLLQDDQARDRLARQAQRMGLLPKPALTQAPPAGDVTHGQSSEGEGEAARAEPATDAHSAPDRVNGEPESAAASVTPIEDENQDRALVTVEQLLATLPRLDSMQHEMYARIGEYRRRSPDGCSEGCPCRAQALDYGDQLVWICNDPKRYRRLQMSDTRSRNKELRATHAATLGRIAAVVDAIAEVGPREVALAARYMWDGAGSSFHVHQRVQDAAERQGVAVDQIRNLQWTTARGPVQVMRLLVEAALRDDIQALLDGTPLGGHVGELVRWYLGEDDPTRPGGAGRPPDGGPPAGELGCERCGAGDHSTRFCIQGDEGNAGDEVDDVTAAVHETDTEIARSASEPDEPDVADRDSRSIGAFVDACLQYGSFSGFVVDALMEHFDVRPKAAAEAELRSGVERWKARNPKYKSYYPTKSHLPAELARELEQRQSAAGATTPAAQAEPKANGNRQERQAFAQLRQTTEYKAVATHEIRRAAFVEGVRLAVRGEPLDAWRKQHPWQR